MKRGNAQVTVSKQMLFFSGCVIALIGFVAGTRLELDSSSTTGALNLSSVQQTYQQLKSRYDGKLDSTALIEGANKGMVAAAGDKYTAYYGTEEAKEFQKELNGDVGAGIGAEIVERNDLPTIARILPNNPAANSGLKVGDVIVKVNDESTEGWDADKTARTIRGEAGTSVKVVVLRDKEHKEATLVRQTINNPSVYGEVKGKVGIMTISRFDEETGALARKLAERFVREGVRGVVVDVRGDGGGYVDAATATAGLWLEDTEIMTQRKGSVVQDRQRTKNDAPLKSLKTVVLVNEGTASASEILAAALREKAGAQLVGQKTFGKGSVQEVLNLPEDTLLKVTVARWYTANGLNVTGKGLAPDVAISMSRSDIDNNRDPQLAKALELLGK